MITLVIGPPDSGKSELAEDLAVKAAEGLTDPHLSYIATMKVLDEAGRERVMQHRRLRSGKGFETIEEPIDLTAVSSAIKANKRSVVLLECMANLVGNLMHDDPVMSVKCRQGSEGEEAFVSFTVGQVAGLAAGVYKTIVVTSVYEADAADDADTALYKKLLNAVNRRLSAIADSIYDTGDGSVRDPMGDMN